MTIDYADNVVNLRSFISLENISQAVRAAIEDIKNRFDGTGVLKIPNGTYTVDETAFEGIKDLKGLVIEGTTIYEPSNYGTIIQYKTSKDYSQGEQVKPKDAMLFFGYDLLLIEDIKDLPQQGKNLIVVKIEKNSNCKTESDSYKLYVFNDENKRYDLSFIPSKTLCEELKKELKQWNEIASQQVRKSKLIEKILRASYKLVYINTDMNPEIPEESIKLSEEAKKSNLLVIHEYKIKKVIEKK